MATKETTITNVVFKNTGQTPAYDVNILIGIDFREYPLLSTLNTHYVTPIIAGGKGPIPQGGVVISQLTMEKPLTHDEIKQLSAGTHAIYVTGKITYKDTFGNERFTKFLAFHNKSVSNRHF
jgi:hypothetical protein